MISRASSTPEAKNHIRDLFLLVPLPEEPVRVDQRWVRICLFIVQHVPREPLIHQLKPHQRL